MPTAPARFSFVRRGLVPAAALTWLAAGCDFIKPPGTTLVQVHVVHHATPDALGNYPDRGGEGQARRFDNDEGWSIVLGDGFVTIASVEFEDCSGRFAPIELQRGVMAEDFSDADSDPQVFGALDVGKASICAAIVHYAPFDETQSEVKPRANVEGTTVYLHGSASNGGAMVEFEVRASAPLDIRLPLTNAEGQPLRVTGHEDFPIELHLSKTYDRFFDGVDFNALGGIDLESQALAVLELETRIGTDR